MNNAHLVTRFAYSHGLSKVDAHQHIDGIFAAITDTAVRGEEIASNGFGKFKVRRAWRAMAAIREPARR